MAGIHRTCPYIPSGRSTPPLPLSIECTSADEANLVMQALRNVLDPILPEPSTRELASVLSTSPLIQNLLNDENQEGFYAVVVGCPPGVHRTEQGAIQAGASFSWPKWKRTDTLCDALVYMVVKGNEAQLPPVVIQVPTACPREPDIDDLNDLFESVVHVEPPGPSAHVTNSPGRASPIIYTHVRSLRGIIESRYVYSIDAATHTRALTLGTPAARYLTAHGYMREAIDRIIRARNRASSDHEFALCLSQHGLAVAEGLYLWHLIQLR
ncbi:hypothetical protein PISMIDRAFT_17024 [Pisolithus microcarpus 441]|uniref:Uncharacterized protein n=1 Tax=Pisolithus microcarpus 441 TaxID=765257 RepID=A0A0C9Z448_9AGAM|nr:hypothetical protein PISMIDRAFT_17024 [Pisolithus microcarpus 441]